MTGSSGTTAGGGQSGGGGAGRRPRRFAFDIASDFAEARNVQKQILDEVDTRGFSDNDVFAVKLSLEEAVINAIKHGNQFDARKRVQVEAVISDDEIDIVIHDQGAGFDRGRVPDPTLAENIEKSCGRGILLIEAYMTHVDWGDDGRRLHMRKVREPAPSDAMIPRAS